jgi:hypothetical protein
MRLTGSFPARIGAASSDGDCTDKVPRGGRPPDRRVPLPYIRVLGPAFKSPRRGAGGSVQPIGRRRCS